MINVTKPFLPPIEAYMSYLNDIWERNWLTNDGPLVKELEAKLMDYLGGTPLHYVSNGTIAIQIAIKALELDGEIITTPFSYVATTSSIVWENCRPVFVDVDAQSFNIDPHKIEAAITEQTSGILATHVYGNPCDIAAIAAIAQKYNLKVIYDAAHCFGSLYKGKSVFAYGDVSTTSFHATKLFHTTEGGAVFASNEEVFNRIRYMRNFGHDGPGNFNGVGINGKNSELHAAMGLANLQYIDQIREKRKTDHQCYDSYLADAPIVKPFIAPEATFNHSYYPVVFESVSQCVAVYEALAEQQIFARRYFYPVLSSLDYVEPQSMPVAEDIAQRILCLPLYHELKNSSIETISKIILKTLKL